MTILCHLSIVLYLLAYLGEEGCFLVEINIGQSCYVYWLTATQCSERVY